MSVIRDHILGAYSNFASDLVLSASITAEFKEKLLGIININLCDYLSKSSALVGEAQ